MVPPNGNTCRVQGCEKVIPPKYALCAVHYRMLPQPLRDLAEKAFEDGDVVLQEEVHEALRQAAFINATVGDRVPPERKRG